MNSCDFSSGYPELMILFGWLKHAQTVPYSFVSYQKFMEANT
jgi:hypothetical protein